MRTNGASYTHSTHYANAPLLSLSDDDRERLFICVHRGYTSARIRTRGQVLHKLGEGWSEAEVCRAFAVCRNDGKQCGKTYM